MSVPSPCTNICRMSPDTGWCEGCQRTIDEITRWSRTTDDDRRGILADTLTDARTSLLEHLRVVHR